MADVPAGKMWEQISPQERRKGVLTALAIVALGWPSLLAANGADAGIEALKLSLYVNCVVQGAKYPDLDYKDRMERIDGAGEGSLLVNW